VSESLTVGNITVQNPYHYIVLSRMVLELKADDVCACDGVDTCSSCVATEALKLLEGGELPACIIPADIIRNYKFMEIPTTKKEVCRMFIKFDGHYTPECVDDHGLRLNGHAKPYNYGFCPFCGKEIFVPKPFKNGNYSKTVKLEVKS